MKRKLALLIALCLTAILSATSLIACDNTVKQTGIDINETEIVLGVGDIETLTANVKPENATDKSVVWESSNESVATVANGAVTAVAEGTATITAKTADGAFSDVCQLEVVKAGMAKFLYTETSGSCTITGLRDVATAEIDIPDSVTDIESDAFYDAEALSIVSIGSGISSIDNDWFSNCMNLRSITIGENVESIGEEAFIFCENLIEVINKSAHFTIEKGSTENGYVGKYAIDVSNRDVNYQKKVSVEQSGVVVYADGAEKTIKGFVGNKAEITIPNGITAIDAYVFADCEFLTSVIMPNGITSIGEGAFYGCTSLEKMVLGSGLTAISEYTFYGCTSMKLFEMQNGVKVIGKNAFDGCINLELIVVSADIQSIKEYAFNDCASIQGVCKRDMRGSGGISGITEVAGNSAVLDTVLYYYSPEKPTWLGNFWRYVDGVPTILVETNT